MTSVYETEKIYPPIPATAPPDDDNKPYRLKKIDELEKFLRSEVDLRDKLTKRFKRRATATSISDTSVLAAITTLEAASIATLITGIGVPISVILASTGLLPRYRIHRDPQNPKNIRLKSQKARQNQDASFGET